MTHIKKYWIWYLIAIVVVVAAILAYSNWETVKGWFSPTPGAIRQDGCLGKSGQECDVPGVGCGTYKWVEGRGCTCYVSASSRTSSGQCVGTNK